MNEQNQTQIVVDSNLAPRRDFLRNSLLLAVPVVLGGISLPAAAAFNPPSRARGGARISVRNHGARGNGSTDDTAAFQRAINALPSGGGTVVVPNGTYVIDPTRKVKLRGKMHLQLASGAKLLAKANSAPRAYVLYAENAHDLEISGGQIVGDRYRHKGTTGQWGHGIMIRGCNRVTVRDIRLSDCWGDGISVASRKLTTQKAPWAPSQDVVIANIVSTGNRRQGMSIGGVRNMKVYDSEFSNTRGIEPGCGIDIEPDKFNLDRAENVRIQNCLIRGNEGNGILVYHRTKQIVVTGCRIERNDGFGVLTMGSTAGTVTANKLGHNRLDGLCVGSGSRDYAANGNYFRNNTTRNHGLVGVNLAWNSTDWTRMSGQVGGRNGTQSHLSVTNASNVRIGANFDS